MKSRCSFILLQVAILIVFIGLSYQGMSSSKVELAINCGGDEYRSHSGILYKKV